jgi:CheY-like chemotaxis protein
MRNTLIDILEEEGFDVESAKDGREAVDRFKNKPFNTVIMDVMMPEINGVEAFQEMKRLNQDTKAIFMSAFAREDLRDKVMEDGAVAFLHKPIDPCQLIDLLEQLSANGG